MFYLCCFLIFVSVVTEINTAASTCMKLQEVFATSRNANWYPANCTTSDNHNVREKCYLVCKDDFIFNANEDMLTECLNISGTPAWYLNNLGKCVKAVCPKLVGQPFVTKDDLSCNDNTILPGENCTLKQLTCGATSVGVTNLMCRENGTWNDGGIYCKEKRTKIEGSVELCRPVTCSTDPTKSYADVRRYIQKPTLVNINPLQLKIGNTNEKSIPIGTTAVSYDYIYNTSIFNNWIPCRFDITVLDKEKPRPANCLEEIEAITLEGNKVPIPNIQPANFSFVDNSNEALTYSYVGTPRSTQVSALSPIKIGFKVADKSHNSLMFYASFQVHARKCQDKYYSTTADHFIVKATPSFYFLNCDAGYSSYGTQLSRFGYTNIPIYACNHSTFKYTKPLIGCYKPIPKKTDGTCPTGSVIAAGSCMPCPKGFRYSNIGGNATCVLCSSDTTTTSIGSSTCTSCPTNSRTTMTTPPMKCEYFCSPGSKYAENKCTVCPLRFYAELGSSTCTRCPDNKVTLQTGSKLSGCVYGRILTSSGKKTGNNTGKYLFLLKIENIPTNQLKQRLAINFDSKYLRNQANCTNNYVQVKSYFEEFERAESAKLCGEESKTSFVIKFRPWRKYIVQYVYQNKDQADMSVLIGIASCGPGEYFSIGLASCSKCPAGQYQDKVGGAISCLPCPANTVGDLQGQSYCIKDCPDGFKLENMRCAPCPRNTYGKNGICESCPVGKATDTVQSTKSDCLKRCGKGEYRDGTVCKKCAKNTYQNSDNHAQTVCLNCKKSQTTASTGASMCVDYCHYEGEYFNTLSLSCEACSIGSYKVASDNVVTECTKCPVGATTVFYGSVRASDCYYDPPLTSCKVNNPCQFPGRCVSLANNKTSCVCPRFYTGAYCGKVAGPCTRGVCANNGTCHALNDLEYKCECKGKYYGPNCLKRTNPCEVKPCKNKGTCSTKGDGLFNCNCLPKLFNGTYCQNKIGCSIDNICGNGTCRIPANPDTKIFNCHCKDGYEGVYCEKKITFCEKYPLCNEDGTQSCEEQEKDRKCHCKPNFAMEDCSYFLDSGTKCQPGKFLVNGTSCCPCFGGTYLKEENYKSKCKRCSTGSSTMRRGASECVDITNMGRIEASVTLPSVNELLLTKPCEEFGYIFAEEMSNELGDVDGLKGILVTSMEQTSFTLSTDVLVNFTVYGTDLLTKLNGLLDDSKIGSLSVYKNSLKIVSKPCDMLPCKNKGTCKDVNTSYKCTCTDGFFGDNCEKECEAGNFLYNQTMCCKCKVGTYSTKVNSSCTNCPTTVTTLERGSKAKSDCIDTSEVGKVEASITSSSTSIDLCETIAQEFEEKLKNEIGNVKGIVVTSLTPVRNVTVMNFTIYGSNKGILSKLQEAVKSGNIKNILPATLTIVSKACAMQPCKNKGMCKDVNTSYKCTCTDGFSGDNCEKEEEKRNRTTLIIVLVVVGVVAVLVGGLLYYKFKYKGGASMRMVYKNGKISGYNKD